VVTAIGNVRITYPERGMVATARQAQYYTREGRLVLSGDVDIIDRDGQRLRADQIVYWLNGQRLLALPAKGQQVQTRLRFDVKPAALSPRPPLP
jgi:lipopolysaccharide export system protein LptA